MTSTYTHPHTHNVSLLLKVNSLDALAYSLEHSTHKVLHKGYSTGEFKKINSLISGKKNYFNGPISEIVADGAK